MKSKAYDITTWRDFKYNEVFDYIGRGKRLIVEDREAGDIPFFSATKLNNGCSDKISNPLFTMENAILYTTFGDAYYVEEEFTASDEVTIFKDKQLNKYNGIFIATIIYKNKYKYDFGRKAFRNLILTDSIKLPIDKQGNPNWQFMENIGKKHYETMYEMVDKTPASKPKINLEGRRWKNFIYSNIFNIQGGAYSAKPETYISGNIPFISATDGNNGVSSWHSLEEIEFFFEGEKYITISKNGSIGYAYYQAKKFTCSRDVNLIGLKDRKFNKYTALFICSLIGLERFKWNYGRKWNTSKMRNSIIKLPVDSSGEPDWQFMEDYIKSVPYSSNL